MLAQDGGNKIQGLGPILRGVSFEEIEFLVTGWRHTLNLLVALPVEAANLLVLLLQHLEAPRERIGDLQIVVLIVTPRPAVVERGLHLANCRNHLLCFFNQAFLLRRYKTDLVVEGI